MEENIQTINIADANYPAQLKEISSPPKTLYAKGALKTEKNCIAVVGTRMYSDYGKQTVFDIVQGLVDAGLTIVSGLAPGIDTLAHQVAVENRARTIAVLGTGLDKKSIYPQTNLELADKIIENNGSLVSEYPPGTRGTRFTFPQRNRIIAGLSLGVLVVEAKEKSGSLITADWARKQGKKIFAVPGSIYSSNSKGCNYLIKGGAIMVENAKDVLKELGIDARAVKKAPTGGNAEVAKILQVLTGEALEVDKIIKKTGLPTKTVLSILPVLEIEGKIKNLGNNVYAISHR